MPSPFPGMNPFIEQDAFWHDFHLEFLPAIRARLVAQVRPKYIVMLNEHLYVQETVAASRRLVGLSDVSLAAGKKSRPREAGAALEMLDAPTQVQVPVQDLQRVPFVEVRDRLGRELIAVAELLSALSDQPERSVFRRARGAKKPTNGVDARINLTRDRPHPAARGHTFAERKATFGECVRLKPDLQVHRHLELR